MRKRSDNELQLTLIFAEQRKMPDGSFITVPRKPRNEVGPCEAARILNVSKSSLSNIINMPKGQQIIRWRWVTEKQGKRMFETESLMRYLQAMGDPEPNLKLN